MPPVLGPWSPSKARFWSWAVSRIWNWLPLTKAKSENSSPSKNSSMTTRAPESPNLLSKSISMSTFNRLLDSFRHDHTLAQCRSVRLDHDWCALLFDVGFGFFEVGKCAKGSVGMPYLTMICLAKSFDHL